MAKKKEDKKLTKDQAEKKILSLKRDLFNLRFKKVNNQINNPAQYNEIKKSNFQVMLDDRDERFGKKIKDSELIGIPLNIITVSYTHLTLPTILLV